jgi:SAM-dependent methyltransferase
VGLFGHRECAASVPYIHASEVAVDKRQRFYAQVLGECIADRQARILVVAAGERDRQVFQALRFKAVVFSNLGEGADFGPFEFAREDAEDLSFNDEAFDFAVIHEALHHCHSPHRALLELYRVARRGVLAVEARDSLLMRTLERWGLADAYEQRGLYHAGGEVGGVRGGPVPNFIYRWTEREVEKAVHAYAPHRRNTFRYFYGHDAPVALSDPGPRVKKLVLRAAYGLYRLFVRLFPRQQNLFAFFVAKGQPPAALQPWIELAGGKPRLDMAWGRRKYGARRA